MDKSRVLSESERNTIVNGLRVAAERFREHVRQLRRVNCPHCPDRPGMSGSGGRCRMCGGSGEVAETKPGCLSLADQFERQTLESEALALMIEDSPEITVNDTGTRTGGGVPMQSMTYGTLPTREEWGEAFDKACPSGLYAIKLGPSDSRAVDDFKLGDGEWNEQGLWYAVSDIVAAQANDGPIACEDCDVTTEDLRYETECPSCGVPVVWKNDAAMGVASAIMHALGFEWI